MKWFLMIDFNEEARDIGLRWLVDFREIFVCPMYEAVTVADFIMNKDKIRPARSLFYSDYSLVNLTNVNYIREGPGAHKLQDMTGSIYVGFHKFWSNTLVKHNYHDHDARRRFRESGEPDPDKVKFSEGRLFEVQLLYHPKKDRAYFFKVEQIGPPGAEPEESKIEESDIALA